MINYFCFHATVPKNSILKTIGQDYKGVEDSHDALSFRDEIIAAEKNNALLIYDIYSGKFTDGNGNEVQISGKRVWPRTYIKTEKFLIEKIQSAGGIPLDDLNESQKILNWCEFVQTERGVKKTTFQDFLSETNGWAEGSEVFVKPIDVMENKFTAQCVLKDGVWIANKESHGGISDSINEQVQLGSLFKPNDSMMVSPVVKINRNADRRKKEWRVFVVDNKPITISDYRTGELLDEAYVAEWVKDKVAEIDGKMPSCYVMDVMEYSDNGTSKLDIVEFNSIAASGTNGAPIVEATLGLPLPIKPKDKMAELLTGNMMIKITPPEEREKIRQQEEEELKTAEASSLGIESDGMSYHRVLPTQTSVEEYVKTLQFLENTFREKNIPSLPDGERKLEFINYGNTQLVYVLSVGDEQFAVLMGQPSVKFGTVRKEFDNLRLLAANAGEHVVKPFYYKADEALGRELYIAPYHKQARCVAASGMGMLTKHTWGCYVPEPMYRFAPFAGFALPFMNASPEKNETQFAVNSSIVAILIKAFDYKKGGVADCQIAGGDFILEKGYENDPQTPESIIKRLKLIAARELLKVPLDEYIEIIRREFSKQTYYDKLEERDPNILVYQKARCGMTPEEIETGIQMGLEMRKKVARREVRR